ncbi:hypothetical protein LGN17_28335 [Burkholderia sp. AU30280]|uniref:hypothetical protein n=1 Tax=Burkholderia sp. AU30280 TaxID=2879628 RepID=UPI001CF124CD|nr:hypothetical protein [Burkholderia sp. AU30280]MCA8276397.1 hypothetical protein [Burkholderia sp. AU30280]
MTLALPGFTQQDHLHPITLNLKQSNAEALDRLRAAALQNRRALMFTEPAAEAGDSNATRLNADARVRYSRQQGPARNPLEPNG